jgi:hypothetical protein
VFGSSDAVADARVQAIISANQSVPPATRAAVTQPAPDQGLLANARLSGVARHLH